MVNSEEALSLQEIINENKESDLTYKMYPFSKDQDKQKFVQIIFKEIKKQNEPNQLMIQIIDVSHKTLYNKIKA